MLSIEFMFPELKPFQRDALLSLNQNFHTVLVAATGSGKSLVFQKYLYDFRSSTRAIIVTPLNALARQIADGLKQIQLNVKLGVGRVGEPPPTGSGVWIVSPEKIFSPGGFSKARAWQPNLMIVDEAHCVWEWGAEFRPDFSRLPGLVSDLKIKKTFWCSATLPGPALNAISQGLPSEPYRIGRFSIPVQLRIERMEIPSHRKLILLRNLLGQTKSSSGMIFVSTRASAERLRLYLKNWGFPAMFYHAGMSPEERVILETKLSKQDPLEPIWVVATSAFGMGMNYPFLKTCILFEPSLSLLALAQALGRVARGSESAGAYVFWHEDDFRNLRAMMSPGSTGIQRLNEVKTWCATHSCPKQFLENYFNAGEISGTFDK